MSGKDPSPKQAQFGFPEIWDQVYAQYSVFLEAAKELEQLTEEILQMAQTKAVEPADKAVFVLSRLTAIGLTELLVLAANGCGQGAMKIARGMFESAVCAEYLRRHPEEAGDYIDFGQVVLWKRYQWVNENTPEVGSGQLPEAVRRLEENFSRVKSRFTNNGRLRNHWHRKSIAQMAEDVGRKRQYELPYGIACSIHHGSFEGVLSYFEGKGGDASFGAPPSLEWITQGLIFGHTSLLQALDTLNDCLSLGFDKKIKGAFEKYRQVWAQLMKKRNGQAASE